MKLLIVTQVVDTQDQALGFFHAWIEEFAKHCEQVTVICLKEGEHSLPQNVQVLSLGKERGASRVKYILNFYRYMWLLRHDYDTVFVHMNEEYVNLGGLPWRLIGKRIVLWRNHAMGSWRTRLAMSLSDVVCHTSPQAFVASSTKAVRMPVGIDTKIFTPSASLPPRGTILFLGRLDPVKKPEVFFEALTILAERGVNFTANLYGTPTDPQAPYAQKYATLAAPLVLRSVLTLALGVPHAETPQFYQSHAIYVNLTPSGSFDKTIGEAMAAGCVVVTANEALRDTIPDDFIVSDSAESVADALEKACAISDDERRALGKNARAYILQEHSLHLLVERLQSLFGTKHEAISQR